MKQILQSRNTGDIQLQDVPVPLCQNGGVLVQTACSLISAGTERQTIELSKKSLLEKARARPDLLQKVLHKIRTEGLFSTAEKVRAKLEEPLALGYSCSGIVMEAGQSAGEFKRGDRVACAGAGFASHAEYNFVQKNLCALIPSHVSYEEATFTTMGAIALQGIRRAELTPGEKVGVIGLGLLGQITVQILLAYGFPVFGLDIDEAKLKKCFDFGLSAGGVIGRDEIEKRSASFTGMEGLDAVIITASTGSNQPVELAGQLSRKKGRVIVVGLVGMDIPRTDYYEKELDFRMSCSYGPGRYDPGYEEKGIDYPFGLVRWTEKRNMEEFIRLLSERKLKIDQLITHRFDIHDFRKAYDLLLDGGGAKDYSGIILRYPQDEKTFDEKTVLTFCERQDTPKDQVTIGLIGAGSFARGVLLPALKRIESVQIRAVCSATGKSARDIAMKYRAQYSTTDSNRILNDNDINAVVISTRHHLHARLVIEALKRRKHVFVEKPLCLTPEELDDIVREYRTVSSAGGAPVLMVGFNRRFAPLTADIKACFSRRGFPLMMNCRVNAGFIDGKHWTQDAETGGGRIVGEVCHFVDLLQFIAGSAPVQVYAVSPVRKDGNIPEDNVHVLMNFADGSRGHILYTAMGDPSIGKEYLEVFGDGKSRRIDDFRGKGLFPAQDKGHRKELERFTESVLKGTCPPIPFEELAATTRATFKIIESLRLGKPVAIDQDFEVK